ncbi:hypothetical protein [Rhizobium sp. NRK18]|uniref:hypothetical protein n=1 Tax=Rhizobium sp. NRK18 TaxID=2964667 RepID=UPI0021C2C3C0|nr:hypothetical protein [Rhizobium sp. NRK18]MCQ2002875.1 hypothetical protein [Rhizobium sp. NRK18]
MTNHSQDEKAFVRRVEDAVEQLRLMYPWEHDRDHDASEWQTVYAVDADIFTLYGSPETKAQRTEQRLGYSQVFSDDFAHHSRSLAERLADFIFFKLTANNPLLVLPPIDREISSILQALTLRLGREPERAFVDEAGLKASLEQLQSESGETMPFEVFERFSQLISLRGKSPQTEYRRLSYLLEQRRIISANSVRKDDGFPQPIYEFLSKESGMSEMYEHSVLSSEWLHLLEDAHGGNKFSNLRRVKLMSDSYALARLEQMNKYLESYKIRVLYITGSLNIIRAAYQRYIENIRFYRKYIRHPRYFLASPDVVAVGSQSGISGGERRSQFYDWVLTFLSECEFDPDFLGRAPEGFHINQNLLNAAVQAFQKDEKIGLDLRDKWRNYLDSLSSSYMPPDSILERIKQDIGGKALRTLTDWERVRDSLDDQIEYEKHQAWEACFKTAIRTGTFVGWGLSDHPSRLVPPLRFDRWPETESFLQTISAWRAVEDIEVETYNNGLETVRAETGEDYIYAYYIAHAALFAARGDWRVGAILSVRAIEKATYPEPAHGTTGHGREACYLAAYCFRHLGDIEKAHRYLDRAKAIHEKELVQEASLLAVPERFEAEELAIQLMDIFQKHYDGDNGSEVVALESIRRDYLELSEMLRKSSYELRKKDDLSRVYDCVEKVLSRVNANICMISIVSNNFDNVFFEAGKQLNSYLEKKTNVSYFLASVDLFWRALSNDGSVTRDLVRRHFSEHEIQDHLVMKYDDARYHAMRSSLIKILNSRKHLN